MICDFHTHVLPGMDDGCRTVEESIEVFRSYERDGVEYVVASPHFYSDQEHVSTFLERRRDSARRLTEAYDGKVKIVLGAEIGYFEGIGLSDRIADLCIEGTRFVMIEMPFNKWKQKVIDDVLLLYERYDIIPVFAHVDRYLGYGNGKAIKRLKKIGCIIQANAEWFIDKATKGRAMRYINRGYVDIIGSDVHGVRHRKQNVGECFALLGQKGYAKAVATVNKCEKLILSGAKVFNG